MIVVLKYKDKYQRLATPNSRQFYSPPKLNGNGLLWGFHCIFEKDKPLIPFLNILSCFSRTSFMPFLHRAIQMSQSQGIHKWLPSDIELRGLTHVSKQGWPLRSPSLIQKN